MVRVVGYVTERFDGACSVSRNREGGDMKPTKRPDIDKYFLKIANVVASRSTCLHRKTGAVLVVDKRVVSVGYNGAPPGQVHCTELGYCAKDRAGVCRAEGCHAESNAIASAARLGIKIKDATLYTVYSPCRACCNLLSVAGVTRVVYSKLYETWMDGPQYLSKTLGIGAVRVR